MSENQSFRLPLISDEDLENIRNLMVTGVSPQLRGRDILNRTQISQIQRTFAVTNNDELMQMNTVSHGKGETDGSHLELKKKMMKRK